MLGQEIERAREESGIGVRLDRLRRQHAAKRPRARHSME
jgi:hypothetical protein